MAKARGGKGPTTTKKASNIIAFQGEPGANSDMACRAAFPYMTTLPCATFETAMEAVQVGRAELAIIPVENSIAGRVADLHSLLPHQGPALWLDGLLAHDPLSIQGLSAWRYLESFGPDASPCLLFEAAAQLCAAQSAAHGQRFTHSVVESIH